MTFERSADGQANRAIFYNVDWIIYTEGGADQQDKVRSYDALFWSGVCRALSPGVRFRAIPKGGKDQLRPLAEQVRDEAVDRVLVAMDRDYDEWLDGIIDHPRVLYTRGYSFENDIFELGALCGVFSAFCPEDHDEDAAEDALAIWASDLLNRLRWPLKVDFFARKCGVKGFDRDRPQKYFVSNAYGSEPKVCRDRVMAEVMRIATELPSRPLGIETIPGISITDIVGHIWEVFAFRALTALQCRYSKGAKVNYEHIRALAISQFQIRLIAAVANDNLAEFYKRQVAAALS